MHFWNKISLMHLICIACAEWNTQMKHLLAVTFAMTGIIRDVLVRSRLRLIRRSGPVHFAVA